jgi:hypothetical protein
MSNGTWISKVKICRPDVHPNSDESKTKVAGYTGLCASMTNRLMNYLFAATRACEVWCSPVPSCPFWWPSRGHCRMNAAEVRPMLGYGATPSQPA